MLGVGCVVTRKLPVLLLVRWLYYTWDVLGPEATSTLHAFSPSLGVEQAALAHTWQVLLSKM